MSYYGLFLQASRPVPGLFLSGSWTGYVNLYLYNPNKGYIFRWLRVPFFFSRGLFSGCSRAGSRGLGREGCQWPPRSGISSARRRGGCWQPPRVRYRIAIFEERRGIGISAGYGPDVSRNALFDDPAGAGADLRIWRGWPTSRTLTSPPGGSWRR